jgi:CheY-like chemotaxis protein
MAELAPLLAVTLGEHQDASMSGLVRLLERTLSDPRRLRALLRAQSATLTHWALTGEPGWFVFELDPALPPMFQAFPLQASLPALAAEGVRLCEPITEPSDWASEVFARQAPRGGNPDRAGLSAGDLKVYTLLDGATDLATVAEKAGAGLATAVDLVRGLERIGLCERREHASAASILVLDDDPEVSRFIQAVLGPDGEGFHLKLVRDRVGAQLLLRRHSFDLVIMALDQPDQEAFFRACKEHCQAKTRFVGIVGLDDEETLVRLDEIGLDGVLHRPPAEADLRATVHHLLEARETAGAT